MPRATEDKKTKSEKKSKKSNTGRFTPAQYDWDKLSEKEKKDIKKYGNPRKLGFLRFVMILLGSQFFIVLAAAFSVTKDDIVIDVAFVNYLIDTIIYTLVFVMIWQRKKATRVFGIAAFTIDFVLTIIDYCLQAGFQIEGTQFSTVVLTSIANLLFIIYFAVSKRVKYACTRPLYDKETDSAEVLVEYFKPKTWPFWRDLIIMFFIFGIVGHWMEFGYCSLIKIGLLPGHVDPTNQIWSDFLFPFPIYGAGAVACALIFFPIKLWLQKLIKNKVLTLLAVFVVSGIICSLMELAMGLATNQDLQLWDYTDMFCNFMGQVCLQNSIGFALAATIMTYIVYPMLKNLFARIERYMNWVFIGVLVFGILLYVFYYFNYLPEQIKQMNPDAYSEKLTMSDYK